MKKRNTAKVPPPNAANATAATTPAAPATAMAATPAAASGAPTETVDLATGLAADLSNESVQAVKPAEDGPFKRTLTVADMVVWGLICMIPISPMAIYGGVFVDSNGMPALAFCIGFIAVLFSVFSFGIMIQHFPSSGSIFTYVSNIMGRGPGFIAGWLMLMQYLVSPTLLYLIAATAINAFLPQVPVWALCLGFLAVAATVSLIGMKTAVAVNRIALLVQLVILALFLGFGAVYVVNHPATSTFAPTTLFDPSKFELTGTLSAVSLAVMSYVGFGAIATLTQEAKDERKGPPRAMLIMAIILGVLFAAQCWMATCIDPTGATFEGSANGVNNAFYIIAQLVAGPWLSVACALGVAISQGVFTAIAQQTSISFVMFTMARGGALPKVFAKMNPRTNSCTRGIVFVVALSVVLIAVFLASGMGVNTVAKFANFGALATYTMLNVAVIVYCWFQLKQRRQVFRHLVFPAFGAAVCFAIMLSVGPLALTVGAVWIAIGIAYYLVLTRVLKRKIDLG